METLLSIEVRFLNKDLKAAVLQCGILSEHINIQRGCRQGDPIAPYLCIICADILAIYIKQNSKYAQDTCLILDGSPKSLFTALDTIDFFSNFSGLKINSYMTKIVWIGFQ